SSGLTSCAAIAASRQKNLRARASPRLRPQLHLRRQRLPRPTSPELLSQDVTVTRTLSLLSRRYLYHVGSTRPHTLASLRAKIFAQANLDRGETIVTATQGKTSSGIARVRR